MTDTERAEEVARRDALEITQYLYDYGHVSLVWFDKTAEILTAKLASARAAVRREAIEACAPEELLYLLQDCELTITAHTIREMVHDPTECVNCRLDKAIRRLRSLLSESQEAQHG